MRAMNRKPLRSFLLSCCLLSLFSAPLFASESQDRSVEEQKAEVTRLIEELRAARLAVEMEQRLSQLEALEALLRGAAEDSMAGLLGDDLGGALGVLRELAGRPRSVSEGLSEIGGRGTDYISDLLAILDQWTASSPAGHPASTDLRGVLQSQLIDALLSRVGITTNAGSVSDAALGRLLPALEGLLSGHLPSRCPNGGQVLQQSAPVASSHLVNSHLASPQMWAPHGMSRPSAVQSVGLPVAASDLFYRELGAGRSASPGPELFLNARYQSTRWSLGGWLGWRW